MLSNMEKWLITVLRLAGEDETFCAVYMKTLLLMHIYTKPCQDTMKKNKYRRICKAVKPQKVQIIKDTLVNSQSLDLQNFEEYLGNLALVTE